MNRQKWDEMINAADRMYVLYINTNDKNEKNPAKIVRRLVSYLPKDQEYDTAYQAFAHYVYTLCQNHFSTLSGFSEQIDLLFSRYIEPIDTDWKKEMKVLIHHS